MADRLPDPLALVVDSAFSEEIGIDVEIQYQPANRTQWELDEENA